jgi:hypothetical protein
MSKSGDLAQARRLSVHLISVLCTQLPKASSRRTRARLDHRVGDHLATISPCPLYSQLLEKWARSITARLAPCRQDDLLSIQELG